MVKHLRKRRPNLRPFDNCRALAPDGSFLFNCARDKAERYLKHGGAELVTEDPFTIRLTFQPAGPGVSADPCLSRPLENRCVVCGAEENLSKHHVVPYCYRRWFPNEVGYLTSYDVMAVCLECHDRYELKADTLKRELERKYEVPAECYAFVREGAEVARLRSHANALLRCLDKMPPARIAECLETVRAHYGRPNITRDDLTALTRPEDPGREFTPPSLYVVSRLRSLEEVDAFAVMWREHFLETMRPRYMPPGWTAYRNANGSFGRNDRGRPRNVVERRPSLERA